MMSRLPLLALLVLASLPADAANAASRSYSVTSFDRIRIDGPYEVRLVTGVAPFARAQGANNAALDAISVRVEGRTLIVRKGTATWGGYPGERGGPVTIDIGTHELSTAWINGAGSLTLDRAKGLSFDLNIQGAGAARIDKVAVDQLKIGISGAATARLAGQALKVTAIVRGSSNLDAEGLISKHAVIGTEGPSIIRLTATDTAKVDAMGLSSVTLGGRPACETKAQGSATVSGCR